MTEESRQFVEALSSFVASLLHRAGGDAEYLRDAIEIIDARNLLFREIGEHATDETDNIYALRELARPDEDTMEFVPDLGRIEAIARNFFY